jgi:flagellar basal-body rod protein FlgC
MSLMGIFNVAGSALSAQTVRLNTVASNLSNAESIASDPSKVYRARYPVFQAIEPNSFESKFAAAKVGVKVASITQSKAEPRKQYQPGHALADKDGYIYISNVNVMEQMADMISASRSYQMNAQMLKTTRQMLLKTLQLGR